MSVRAYRVNEIKMEESESFDLWHDDKLIDFLDGEAGIYETRTGLTEVSVEVLEQAIVKAAELELDPSTVKVLQADIDWAKAKKNDHVQYYCY